MSAATPTPLPPIEVVSATNHGAWVIITAAIGLTIGLVCLMIRFYVRLVISPPFSRDDHVHTAATVFAITQSSVIFASISKGFGKSVELIGPGELNMVQQYWVTGDILFIFTLFLSKCCLIALFLRLTPNPYHNKASFATLGLSTVWLIISVFMISVNCELNHPFADITAQCTNMFVRWQIVAAIDIVVEAMLVCLAAFLVRDLKMSMRRKFMVVFAFFFRLPLIAFALLRLHYLATAITSPDPTLNLVGPVIWAQIEMHYANFAATIPCLRPFMSAVSTNYGATRNDEPRTGIGSKAYGSSGGKDRKGASYILSSMASGGRKEKNYSNLDTPSMFRMAKRNTSRINSEFSKNDTKNETTISHGGKHDTASIGSNDSRKMIIKKKIDIHVQHSDEITQDEKLGHGHDGSGNYL